MTAHTSVGCPAAGGAARSGAQPCGELGKGAALHRLAPTRRHRRAGGLAGGAASERRGAVAHPGAAAARRMGVQQVQPTAAGMPVVMPMVVVVVKRGGGADARVLLGGNRREGLRMLPGKVLQKRRRLLRHCPCPRVGGMRRDLAVHMAVRMLAAVPPMHLRLRMPMRAAMRVPMRMGVTVAVTMRVDAMQLQVPAVAAAASSRQARGRASLRKPARTVAMLTVMLAMRRKPLRHRRQHQSGVGTAARRERHRRAAAAAAANAVGERAGRDRAAAAAARRDGTAAAAPAAGLSKYQAAAAAAAGAGRRCQHGNRKHRGALEAPGFRAVGGPDRQPYRLATCTS